MGTDDAITVRNPDTGSATHVHPSGSVTRKGESTWYRILLRTWAPLAHVVLCLTLSTSLVYRLDHARVNSQERNTFLDILKDTSLRASDITTLISVALLLIRIVGQGFMLSTVWRCALILLQHDGLNLSQLDSMIRYRLPTSFSGKFALPIALALLMMLPSVLIAPVVSGSVDWVARDVQEPGGTTAAGFGSGFENASYWGDFRVHPPSRQVVVMEALGFAGTLWAGLEPQDRSDSGLWYRYVANQDQTINTLVDDVPMPYIGIESLTWDNEWEEWAEEQVLNQRNIIYTPGVIVDNTRQSLYPGNAVFFSRDTDFPKQNLPDGEIFSGTWKVAVLVERKYDENQEERENCMKFEWQRWNDLSNITVKPGSVGTCWAMATVKFTTGVKYFQQGEYVTNRVVQGKVETPSSTGKVVGDRWAHYGVYMLSSMMSQMPMTRPGTRGGSLAAYTEELIRHSYIAFRHALAQYTPEDESGNPLQLQIHVPRSYLEAQVSNIRVWVWLVLSILLPASGLVVLWIERSSGEHMRNPTLNTALTPLLTDAREVLVKDQNGLSNMSYVTSKDSKDMGKIRLGLVNTEAGPVYGLKVGQ